LAATEKLGRRLNMKIRGDRKRKEMEASWGATERQNTQIGTAVGDKHTIDFWIAVTRVHTI
jgi:hypothetical protein